MKKDRFGNFFEEWAWIKFQEKPTIKNREVWREAQELNKSLEKEDGRSL